MISTLINHQTGIKARVAQAIDSLSYNWEEPLDFPVIKPSKSNNQQIRTMQSETGTVKWYNTTKGYVFIQPTENDASHKSKDVFVHISALERAGLKDLKEG